MAVVIILLAAVAVWFSLANLLASHNSGAGSAAEPTTYLNLTITFDPATGMASFTTPNVSMVADSLVVVTITNHDPTTGNLYAPWDRQVIGTLGGTELVDSGGGSYSASSLPMGGISHTFPVDDAIYNISVPIPPAPSQSTPSVVTFELTLNSAENTTWACMCDCQGGHMDPGMYGRLTISE